MARYGNTSQSTYGFNGLITSVTNSLSQTTTTTKNAQGLVASVQDPASHTTSYVYDAFGDVFTTTDPAGNVVTNSYDIRGNKIGSDDPDMGTWTYSYDVLGELLSQTDAKNQTTTLTYDLLGRTLSRTENGLFSSWTYGTNAGLHSLGKMVEARACDTSACGTVISDKTFAHDSLTCPSKTVIAADDNNFAYQETYNSANGKLATLAYPSGFSVSYSYNSYGYVTAINGADGALIWQANARDAELHLTSEQQGNGVSTTQTFDPNTGLIQTQQAGASASVANFAYSFDTIGNLKSRTDSIEGFTEQFCYDSLNRLTNSNMGSICTGGKSVTYDSIGNITAKSDTGSYSYSDDGPHAVSSITGTVDGLTNPQYSYDENGNLTCVSTGAGCSGTIGRTVLSTSFNMAGAILQGANSLNLTYDDQHQRIMQVNTVSGAATTTTVYLNDPASGAMSEEVTNAGTTATVWNSFNWAGKPWGGVTADAIPTWVDYIQVDGQIVAQRSVKYQAGDLWGQQNWGSFSWGTPTAGSNWGAFNWGVGAWTGPVVVWEYFTLDHLNSVAVVTDQGGNVLQRLSYDPWGKARNANGSDAACGAISPDTTRGFTNQEQMPVACLVNLNARLYDPSIGKFLGADPVVGDPFAPNAFNRYAYVLNNPLSFTDPSGLCVLGCFWNNPIFRDIAAIAVVVVFQQYEVLPSVLGEGAAFAASNLGMVVNGAILGGVTGGISGGNLKSVGLGALGGALLGGANAALGSEAQAVADNAEMEALGAPELAGSSATMLGSYTADSIVAHGLVGGITSAAAGVTLVPDFWQADFRRLPRRQAHSMSEILPSMQRWAASRPYWVAVSSQMAPSQPPSAMQQGRAIRRTTIPIRTRPMSSLLPTPPPVLCKAMPSTQFPRTHRLAGSWAGLLRFSRRSLKVSTTSGRQSGIYCRVGTEI